MIPVAGLLSDHANLISDCLGWSTYDAIGMACDAAKADAGISAVVLDANSPGGDVLGCQECADRIWNLAQVKPTVGFMNAYATSAAHWLSAQSNLLFMMPSGQVGSVGVVTQHVDYSKANEMEGANVTYLTSSDALADRAAVQRRWDLMAVRYRRVVMPDARDDGADDDRGSDAAGDGVLAAGGAASKG